MIVQPVVNAVVLNENDERENIIVKDAKMTQSLLLQCMYCRRNIKHNLFYNNPFRENDLLIIHEQLNHS